MARGVFFVRPCPTCGRNLEIRIELMGRQIHCLHCGARFKAAQRSESEYNDSRIDQLLARAEQFINSNQTFDVTVGDTL